MKTKLLLILVSSCTLVASCNKQDRVRQKETLREKVNLYMQGQPVKSIDFPWYDTVANRIDRQVLESYLQTKQITEEEFDSLRDPEYFMLKKVHRK